MSTDYEMRLGRLAMACGNMRPTTLANVLLCMCLDDAVTIRKVQERFKRNDDYRIIPIRENDRTVYRVMR